MYIFRVVETDNWGGDYPDEKFVTPRLSQETAQLVANELNAAAGHYAPRYFKVEKWTYKLVPGFEP